jgi:tetratricopeptide (TPR) repeat protein
LLKAQRFIPLLIAGIGLLVYLNSFRDAFVFDDLPHIVQDSGITRLWPMTDLVRHTSRPVVGISLAVNYALGRLNPWGYHAFNVGIHILAALTLYGVVRLSLLSETLRPRWGQAAPWLAAVISLIWLVHPLQTESVTYIIQRGESLMGLFYLLTLYCVIRSAEQSGRAWWTAGAIVSCALGMASKPVMATAPLVVLLYDRVFLAGAWSEALRRRRLLYAGLAATWLLLPWLLANAPSDWKETAGFGYRPISPLQYALTQTGVILHYLRLAFWPRPLCLDYGWEYGWPIAKTVEQVWPQLILAGTLVAGTVWAWQRHPAFGFLGVSFFLVLAPTSSFLPIADLAVEHRTYLPLAAVVTMATVAVFELGTKLLQTSQRTKRVLAGGVTVVVVTVLAALTIQRNRDYRSAIAIWEDTLAKCPNNPRAYNNLGSALSEAGNFAQGIGCFEQAVRIKPDYADAHNNMALALEQTGKAREAIGHFEQTLELKPEFAEAHNNLGVALLRTGRLKEGMAHFERAVQLKPDYADAHYNFGVALSRAGQKENAIVQFQRAWQLNPAFTEARDAAERLRSHS